MEIYFKDLNPEAQKRLLEEAGISNPKEANWDVFPIDIIEFDEEEFIDIDIDDFSELRDSIYSTYNPWR